jgi:hypothetical protein
VVVATGGGGMPSVLSTSSISGRMLLSWSATSAMSCRGMVRQGRSVRRVCGHGAEGGEGTGEAPGGDM